MVIHTKMDQRIPIHRNTHIILFYDFKGDYNTVNVGIYFFFTESNKIICI